MLTRWFSGTIGKDTALLEKEEELVEEETVFEEDETAGDEEEKLESDKLRFPHPARTTSALKMAPTNPRFISLTLIIQIHGIFSTFLNFLKKLLSPTNTACFYIVLS
jgi:hypothetical protein